MNDYSSNTRKFLARRLLRFESLEQRRVLSSHPIATPNAYTVGEDVTLTGNLIGDDTGNGSDQPGNPGGTLVAVAIDGQTLWSQWDDVLGLTVWLAVTFFVAVRLFRWE